MKTEVGDVLILKLVNAESGSQETVLYKEESANFKGDKYNMPVIEGTFIEVEVMRNFRVKKSTTFDIQEMDPAVVESKP